MGRAITQIANRIGPGTDFQPEMRYSTTRSTTRSNGSGAPQRLQKSAASFSGSASQRAQGRTCVWLFGIQHRSGGIFRPFTPVPAERKGGFGVTKGGLDRSSSRSETIRSDSLSPIDRSARREPSKFLARIGSRPPESAIGILRKSSVGLVIRPNSRRRVRAGSSG
jgi:hypothetical protein